MQENNTITFTRGKLGQYASFIGVALLVVAFLAVVWEGGFSPLIYALFGLGAVAVVVWIALVPQEFIAFVTGRQVRQGTVAVFSTLLLSGIIILTYILAERAVITFDMTDAGDFTLSPETIALIEDINRDIQITAFYSPQLAYLRETEDQFFRLYETASDGRITREYIDPTRNPGLASEFRAQDGDVFISYLNPDGSINRESVDFVPMEDQQERAITQAVARLLAEGNFIVYFTAGQGQPDPLDTSSVGISTINDLLNAEGYVTRSLDLDLLVETGESIPDDADALVIIRPQEQFSEPVIGLLENYLDSGGGAFIATDAGFGEQPFLAMESTFNNHLWENWGIRMLDAVAVDEAASGETPLDVISAAVASSEITASINPQVDVNTAAEFRIARIIQVDDDPPVSNGNLIRTTEFSYAETNLERLGQDNVFEFNQEEDFPGPLTTVAFAHDQNNDGKVLLVGDSDFLTNGQVTSPQGNAFLFADAIAWMTGLNEEVSIEPRPTAGTPPLIFVDAERQLDEIAFFRLVLLPGVVLFTGIGVWYWRRRR